MEITIHKLHDTLLQVIFAQPLSASGVQNLDHFESDDDEVLAVLRNLGLLKQAQSPQLKSSDGRRVQACIAVVTNIDSEFHEQRFASPKHSRVLDVSIAEGTMCRRLESGVRTWIASSMVCTDMNFWCVGSTTTAVMTLSGMA